jgi:hypothetical protein
MGITTNTLDLRRLQATTDFCFRLAGLDVESMEGHPGHAEGLSTEACEEVRLDDGQLVKVRLRLDWDIAS